MAPLLPLWASLFFTGLFLLAARHKLSSPGEFRAVLLDYGLFPERLVAPLSLAIPLVEVAVAAAWLTSLAGAVAASTAASATVAVLSAYSLAITVNLLRGRRYVSCGCGLSGSGGEYLSWGLVFRNAVLVVAAVLAALPVAARATGAGGYLVLVGALLCSVLIYIAASQLLRNAAAIGAWRSAHE